MYFVWVETNDLGDVIAIRDYVTKEAIPCTGVQLLQDRGNCAVMQVIGLPPDREEEYGCSLVE